MSKLNSTRTKAPTLPSVPTNSWNGMRWWIITLIFFATCINYIDRQSISLLFPVFSRPEALNISPEQYAKVGSILLFAYMLSQTLSGRFYDRYGSRIGFTASIVLWSFAAMAQSFMTGFAGFAACSFVLGFGEAGNWPGAAKVVAEWFPARERAIGMAIFNSGAAMGSVIAPPLVIGLQLFFGWRTTFLLVGLLGFVWLAAWLWLYQPPQKHRRISAAELAYITADTQSPATQPSIPWRTLLHYRQVWALIAARFCVDPVWWLFVLWLPDYLYKVRGLSVKQIGMFAWAPYLAASLGSLFGGWLAGRLIARGCSIHRARKLVIASATCLMPFGILAARADTPAAALAYIAVVLFGFQMWISNVQTLPSDLFTTSAVGSVAGLGGTGAAIGSMLFILTTGWLVSHFSYALVLTIAGMLAPIGTAFLFALIGHIQQQSTG